MTDQLAAIPAKDIDFNDLVKLAAARSMESREAVFRTVSELLVDYGELRSEKERSLAGDILRHLLHDVEVSLRRDLATSLAARADVSENLISDLANDDEIEVAEPVLRESPLLSDMMLIEIIHNRAATHQLAITRRQALTTDVTSALVATADSEIVSSVIENPGAQFAEDTISFLVEESRAQALYREPLVKRSDLPEALARRLYTWVAEPLREHIVATYAIDRDALDSELDAAIDRQVDATVEQGKQPTRAQNIVRTLNAKGALDARFLMGALHRGNIEVFREGMIELTELPALIIERVVIDHDPRGLAILCRLIGCDATAFEKIFSMSRPAGDALARPSIAQRNRLRAMFDGVTKDKAEQVANHWRDTPDYRTSLSGIIGAPVTMH
jgi:uncharacterized protein (DUF2336 family)